jgi:hypothetical protein
MKPIAAFVALGLVAIQLAIPVGIVIAGIHFIRKFW